MWQVGRRQREPEGVGAAGKASARSWRKGLHTSVVPQQQLRLSALPYWAGETEQDLPIG